MGIPDIKTWEKYSSKFPASIEGVNYPFLKADFYKKTIDGVEWSIGIFSNSDREVLKAWGEKAAPHCKMHTYRDGEEWSKPIYGCPKHSPVRNADEVVGMTLRTGFFKKVRLI